VGTELSNGGHVHAIHVSNGGVPKRPRESCRITIDGVDGDRQRDLRFHGGPMRAVSLYSLDLIDALRQEGHPIDPGVIGENLTLVGVDWSAMVPGASLSVGPVQLTLTAFASPCKNIAPAFRDEHFIRVSQKVHPGWSRLYARVDREGVIVVGDAVTVLLPPDGLVSPSGNTKDTKDTKTDEETNRS
jgi:MOSC domain-containing protein YiiM